MIKFKRRDILFTTTIKSKNKVLKITFVIKQFVIISKLLNFKTSKLKLMKKLTIILFLNFIIFSAMSQATSIFLDGTYDDWENVTHSIDDNLNDGYEIDFIKFTVTNDSNFLYIKLEFSEEIDLTDDNNIYLSIDADNNTNTGYPMNGIGSEMNWNFGQKSGYYNSNGGYEVISFSDIQLRNLPTVTSNIFEIAVGRNVKPNGTDNLFSGDTIKICFSDDISNGDDIPNEGEFFTYIFDNTSLPQMEPILLEKENSDFIRLMTYNIQADFDNNIGGLDDPERIPNLIRIFTAISPDIITINECWDTDVSVAENFLNTNMPLENENGWYVNKLDGANFTASRFPIIETWNVYQSENITACLFDLSEKNLQDILIISAHFKCCDDDPRRQLQADAFASFILDVKKPGGNITLPENTPFILMGDLNLVGVSQQLKTLITGDIQNIYTFGLPAPLDWDNTDLTDLISSQTDKRTAYTWRNDYSSYSPGRLDFMIFSDYTMTVEKAYTLQTEIMPQSRLNLYELQQFDTKNSSDHFPKIADFTIQERVIDTIPKLNIITPTNPEIIVTNTNYTISWNSYLIDTISEKTPANKLSFNWLVPRNIIVSDSQQIIIKDINSPAADTSNLFYISTAESLFSIFPNPAKDIIFLDFKNHKGYNDIREVEIIDLYGKTISHINLDENYRQSIDLSSYQAGIYYMKMIINNEIYFKKIVLIK